MKHRGTAVVTGATGMIGGEVARCLSARGWEVRAVVRAPDATGASARLLERLAMSPAQEGGGRLRAIPGDPTLPALGVRDAGDLEGASLLVHCAGATSFNDDGLCRRVNVGAARRVVEAARLLRPAPRVVYLSTASVCMAPTHSVLDERAEFRGFANGYTRSKREAERVFLESGLEASVLRPSIVLSRGIANRAMARSILWVVPAFGEMGHAPVDPESRLDIVPVDFVAHAVAAFVERRRPRHSVYNVSAGPAASVTIGRLRDAVVAVCPKAAKVSFARAPARGSASADRRLRERLARAVGYYEPFLNADIAYSPARLVEELGDRMPVCPPAASYIAELLEQVEVEEAVRESQRP